MRASHITFACAMLAFFARAGATEKPKAAAEAVEAEPPRPATRTWGVVTAPFAATYAFNPGIGVPNSVSEITLMVHVKAGAFSKPASSMRVTVEVLDPKGTSLGNYLAHAVPRARGRYALHVTPRTAGMHTLKAAGNLSSGEGFEQTLYWPVDIWPLPDSLQGEGDADAPRFRAVVKRPSGPPVRPSPKAPGKKGK